LDARQLHVARCTTSQELHGNPHVDNKQHSFCARQDHTQPHFPQSYLLHSETKETKLTPYSSPFKQTKHHLNPSNIGRVTRLSYTFHVYKAPPRHHFTLANSLAPDIPQPTRALDGQRIVNLDFEHEIPDAWFVHSLALDELWPMNSLVDSRFLDHFGITWTSIRTLIGNIYSSILT
jgi:hypothetical protein